MYDIIYSHFSVWVLIKFDYAIIVEQYVTNCMRFEAKEGKDTSKMRYKNYFGYGPFHITQT